MSGKDREKRPSGEECCDTETAIYEDPFSYQYDVIRHWALHTISEARGKNMFEEIRNKVYDVRYFPD